MEKWYFMGELSKLACLKKNIATHSRETLFLMDMTLALGKLAAVYLMFNVTPAILAFTEMTGPYIQESCQMEGNQVG